MPSPALDWPCGQPTCTGQCQLCGIKLRTGPLPRNPQLFRRPPGSGTLDRKGYVIIKTGAACYKFHRLIYVIRTGLPIPPGHDIHHRDGVVTHNCPANLELISHADHTWLTHHETSFVTFCEHCQRPIRNRSARNGPGLRLRFCSKSCALRARHASPRFIAPNPLGFYPYDPADFAPQAPPESGLSAPPSRTAIPPHPACLRRAFPRLVQCAWDFATPAASPAPCQPRPLTRRPELPATCPHAEL